MPVGQEKFHSANVENNFISKVDGRHIFFLTEISNPSFAYTPEQLEDPGGKLKASSWVINELSFETCEERACELLACADEMRVRSATLVGFQSTASLALAVTLLRPKFVRHLILIDPQLRPHPTRSERFVQAIERRLPLGLPLRSSHTGFDAEPFLQRVRVPILVVSCSTATAVGGAKTVLAKAPLSWHISRSSVPSVAELWQYISDFQDVALKHPMRRV